MRTRFLTSTVVAALLVAAGVVGFNAGASAGDQPIQQVPAAKRAPVITQCNGGQLINMKSRSTPDAFAFLGTSGPAGAVNVPGTMLKFTGPSAGADTILVTFSAETYYYATAGWLSLEAFMDGSQIQPYAANGTPFAFVGVQPSGAWQSSSTQFCAKVGPGRHRLVLRASTTGSTSDTGWLDDYTFTVERFD